MIRVAVIDDQTLVRRGIRSLLELADGISVVAEAADGEEGIAVIRRERPDVVLLDIRMPRKDGLDGGWLWRLTPEPASELGHGGPPSAARTPPGPVRRRGRPRRAASSASC